MGALVFKKDPKTGLHVAGLQLQSAGVLLINQLKGGCVRVYAYTDENHLALIDKDLTHTKDFISNIDLVGFKLRIESETEVENAAFSGDFEPIELVSTAKILFFHKVGKSIVIDDKREINLVTDNVTIPEYAKFCFIYLDEEQREKSGNMYSYVREVNDATAETIEMHKKLYGVDLNDYASYVLSGVAVTNEKTILIFNGRKIKAIREKKKPEYSYMIVTGEPFNIGDDFVVKSYDYIDMADEGYALCDKDLQKLDGVTIKDADGNVVRELTKVEIVEDVYTYEQAPAAIQLSDNDVLHILLLDSVYGAIDEGGSAIIHYDGQDYTYDETNVRIEV